MNVDKCRRITDFLRMTSKLKQKVRTGWDEEHWNVKNVSIERILEHAAETCMIAICMYDEHKTKIDLDKVLRMLLVHDIPEAAMPDITPYDGISEEDKNKMEEIAMQETLGLLENGQEWIALLNEFNAKKTEEAKFAFYCDKFSGDFQSKVYQDTGCHQELNDAPMVNHPKIQEAINDGAKTVFEVWKHQDEKHFEDTDSFKNLLDYIAKNDVS